MTKLILLHHALNLRRLLRTAGHWRLSLILLGLLASSIAQPQVSAQTPVAPPIDQDAIDLIDDGLIAQVDVIEVVRQWNEFRESGISCGADSRTDVTNDGCVDIADIQRVASQIGTMTDDDSQAQRDELRDLTQVGQTFVVTTTSDVADANPGDGVCDTGAGECSLRAAIEEANLESGSNAINFDILGVGPHSINIANPLPTLADTSGGTLIDGYSQPGASVNSDAAASNAVLMIELVGPRTASNPTMIDAFVISSSGNTLQGLATCRFRRSYWLLGGSASNNQIVGNFVGTCADGQPWYDNIENGSGGEPGAKGIVANFGAASNVIGTSAVADRNIISGNANDGISISGENSSSNIIVNNLVGLAANGQSRVRNWGDGIDVNYSASFNRIGGVNEDERNVITGNEDGVEISHDTATTGNLIVGNFIGTDTSGTSADFATYRNDKRGITLEDGVTDTIITSNVLGNNLQGGINIDGSGNSGSQISQNRIGVSLADTPIPNHSYGIKVRFHAANQTIGPANIIANNFAMGVHIAQNDDVIANTITQNAIFNNGGLGIDIDPVGVNPNGAYSKNGPNRRLDFPVISWASPASVQGTACPGCVIEFFLADDVAGNHGEGPNVLGETTADGSGNFDVTLPTLEIDQIITSTATDSEGNTSEFSTNFTVHSNDGPTEPPNLVYVTDDFECGDWTCGSGWIDSWLTSGNPTVTGDDLPYEGQYHAWLSKNDEIARSFNAENATSLTFDLQVKTYSLESSDSASLQISADGAPFMTLRTWTSADNGTFYVPHTFDLTPYLPATEIRLKFTGSMSSSNWDFFYVDALRAELEVPSSQPTPTPTPEPTATATPTATFTPTPSPTPTATFTPTPTPTSTVPPPTSTPTATATPSPTPTATSTPTATATPSPTAPPGPGTAFDDFECGSWGCGSGWLTIWSDSGPAQVTGSGSPPSGQFQALLQKDAVITRSLSTGGAATATLDISVRARSLEAAHGDEVSLLVSSDGAAYSVLRTWTEADNSGQHASYQFDLSPHLSGGTLYIRVESNMSSSNWDFFYVDDVLVTLGS